MSKVTKKGLHRMMMDLANYCDPIGLFGINTEFSQSEIDSFTTQVTRGVDENGKPIITYRSGFLNELGEIEGFVWTRTFGSPTYQFYKYNIRSQWGIAGYKEQVYISEETNDEPNDLPLAGKYYLWGYGGYTKFPKNLLVETIDGGPSHNDTLVYCGMHKNGIYHGLGVKFFAVGDDIVELSGLWQDGKLTHLKINDKLVPVFNPESQTGAESVCKVFDNIVKLPDINPEFAMSLNELSNQLMAPYMDDPTALFSVSERCFKMGEDYREKAFALCEKAVEKAPTLEQKMEWLWSLYTKCVTCDNPRQTTILAQYAVLYIDHPQLDLDLNRCFIALKTTAYAQRKNNTIQPRDYDAAAKAVLDKLVASFEMETDLAQEDAPKYKAGFKQNGQFKGFVWEKEYKSNGGDSCRSSNGIVDVEGNLYDFGEKTNVSVSILDWTGTHPYEAIPVYYTSKPSFLTSWYNVPSMLLLEEDDEHCTFCGMHCNGIRNGLGSQFFFSNEEEYYIAELQGLWLDGKLTHVRYGGKLIPLDVDLNKEDSFALSVIYKNIADILCKKDALDFYNKAIGLREPYKNEESDKNELLFLVQCYKRVVGREEDYIALLSEILDRFGNDDDLAWELFTYLEDRNDPRADQAYQRYCDAAGDRANLVWRLYTYLEEIKDPRTIQVLEHYLDCKDGDPENRLKAASLLKRDDTAKEAYLNTFGHEFWYNHYTQCGGDVDCYVSLAVYGFKANNLFSGYVWFNENGEDMDGDWRFTACGILEDTYQYDYQQERDVPKLACRIVYKMGATKLKVLGDLPKELLVEEENVTPSEKRITFFGMQKNGLRHGLGTEFHWKDDQLDDALKGYWEDGKLTHLVKGDKLEKIES